MKEKFLIAGALIKNFLLTHLTMTKKKVLIAGTIVVLVVVAIFLFKDCCGDGDEEEQSGEVEGEAETTETDDEAKALVKKAKEDLDYRFEIIGRKLKGEIQTSTAETVNKKVEEFERRLKELDEGYGKRIELLEKDIALFEKKRSKLKPSSVTVACVKKRNSDIVKGKERQIKGYIIDGQPYNAEFKELKVAKLREQLNCAPEEKLFWFYKGAR
ncbi:MAG: hypothetical protein PHD51_04715 [Patescibacteria group bacterium]|nr:hypothetical protein [Patescibacteria group bacterium]MDD5043922.1 hypothetical protein [Patescibacteria group bacterium]MDD5490755.1 hypothetical protein [Patescibacteria group bacterium]